MESIEDLLHDKRGRNRGIEATNPYISNGSPFPSESGDLNEDSVKEVSWQEDATSMTGYSRADFHRSPFLVFWEITQACDLVCDHCRACAQPDRHPEELNLPLCHKLIEQLASFPQGPILVLTGGGPMKRDDVFDIIWAGVDAGLTVTMTPSATPLVTPQAIEQLKAAGLSRLAVSLDGVDAATHDGIRGVEGSFQQALQIIREARAVRLPVQINTMVSKRNVEQVDAMAEFIADLDIILWSVFFLVPVGRGVAEQRIAPEQYEEVFERLWHHAETKPYSIKTTEAHHYRRFVLQRGRFRASCKGRRGRISGLCGHKSGHN